ncbi:MAG: glutamine--fructose-6-phosphate transaminase (isomerizing) [Paludibacteraceae bacterium]|nr:glutamine--fructose-6-phosphate transaminase (isomerizing) [Paludibacteraceae bacterium]
MCGIVGYIGKAQAFPVLIKGLHRLEYRGYDSAGVALINDRGSLNIYKAKGKVEELELAVEEQDITGSVGIAHTRWATHGEPSTRNAHPHCSRSERLALVHNGIIENYESLRKELILKGYGFRSDTDTEVLVQLIDDVLTSTGTDLFAAVRTALQRVTGAYAIAVIDKQNPKQIVAARKGSPLVVGISNDALYLASDATPIAEYTSDIIYLDNEQVALLEEGQQPIVSTLKGEQVTYTIRHTDIAVGQLEKNGFEHYMLKEIFEQPDTLQQAMQGCMSAAGDIQMPDWDRCKQRFLNADRILLTACGTSWHAALIAKYAIEQFAHIPCEVEYASEFRYRQPVIKDRDVMIAISQSGETADTLAAIELAKQNGAFIYSICNVQGSSIPRLSDACCYTHIGPEIGVASTKAFTAQVLVLNMLALAIGKENGHLSLKQYTSLTNEMRRLPQYITTILLQNERIAKAARTLTFAADALYLGRGFLYPIALEGALKLKEISYIHAEGYPAAEMKHGPIALVSHDLPVVVVAPKDSLYDKMVSNIREITARHGRVIAVVTEGDTQVRDISELTMTVPPTADCWYPILTIIPLQLLAYHVAVAKDCNVDQPRNLAKSVTVE